MRCLVLASDYDGTLTMDGVVAGQTVAAIERLNRSGRKFILVSGRELADLCAVFPQVGLCARVVAENGAVVYNPATQEKHVLAEKPPAIFIESLRRRGVADISVGDVIVATWARHAQILLQVIQESRLDLHIIFNKDAAMILPSGLNKMTGLHCALNELNLSPHNTVAIGDAENDHAFLDHCECSVAVANAIEALKDKADYVTRGTGGSGVVEIIDKMLDNDLADLGVMPVRRRSLRPE